MSVPRKKPMTVWEFLDWAPEQTERWELIDGVPILMAPERVIHGDTKYRIARAFDEAIRNSGLDCHFVLDSAVVPVDSHSSYQPGVFVYCGEAVRDDALVIETPIIVVEVLSPDSAMKDLRDKFRGYFLVSSIAHYLIVDPDKRLVIHHARGTSDTVSSRILSHGEIVLDPPGLALNLASFFGTDGAVQQ